MRRTWATIRGARVAGAVRDCHMRVAKVRLAAAVDLVWVLFNVPARVVAADGRH